MRNDRDPLPSGLFVRAARKALGWTQSELADRAGLHRVEISNIERGYNQVTSHRARVGLARGFGVPIELISRGVEEGPGVDEARVHELVRIARGDAPSAAA